MVSPTRSPARFAVPSPVRVIRSSKEQQATNSVLDTKTTEFTQAKDHVLGAVPPSSSSATTTLQATKSLAERKRTRPADLPDLSAPKPKKCAPVVVEKPDPYAPLPASVLECFHLLVEREGELQPNSDFIMEEALIVTPGCGVTEQKRTTLMRWVLEVSESFRLNHRTSGHIVALIDCTLYKLPVRRHLALIGLACILIGSKFVEISPVAVDELQRCAPIYTTADILKMEAEVLEILNWDLNVVTVSDMSRCISSQVPAGCRKRVTQLSELMVDLAQSEANPIWWLGQRRSSLALGAVLASLNICGVHFPNFQQFMEFADEKAVQEQCGEFLKLYQANLRAQAASPQNTTELVRPAAFKAGMA